LGILFNSNILTEDGNPIISITMQAIIPAYSMVVTQICLK